MQVLCYCPDDTSPLAPAVQSLMLHPGVNICHINHLTVCEKTKVLNLSFLGLVQANGFLLLLAASATS